MLELDKLGSYIPPCTRNVFLKYFTGADAQQPHFWSPQDRDAYLDAILDHLGPYLLPEDADTATTGRRCRRCIATRHPSPGLFDLLVEGEQVVAHIEIPMIQRDYAQGRESDEVTLVRRSFLRSASLGSDRRQAGKPRLRLRQGRREAHAAAPRRPTTPHDAVPPALVSRRTHGQDRRRGWLEELHLRDTAQCTRLLPTPRHRGPAGTR